MFTLTFMNFQKRHVESSSLIRNNSYDETFYATSVLKYELSDISGRINSYEYRISALFSSWYKM